MPRCWICPFGHSRSRPIRRQPAVSAHLAALACLAGTRLPHSQGRTPAASFAPRWSRGDAERLPVLRAHRIGSLHCNKLTWPRVAVGTAVASRPPGQPASDHALEPEVEHMVEIQVAQQHADRSPLRSSLIAWVDCSIFQNARFQPAPDQIDHARITDSVFDKPEHPFMIKAPEEVLQIRLQHPPDHAASNDLIEGCYCTMGTEPWSAAERAGQKVLLVDGGQHLGRAALESPVRHGWHPKGALLRLSGLGDINAANVGCLISLPVDG